MRSGLSVCSPAGRARGGCGFIYFERGPGPAVPGVQVYRASDLSGSAVAVVQRRPRVNTEQEPGDCAVQVAPPPISSRDNRKPARSGVSCPLLGVVSF